MTVRVRCLELAVARRARTVAFAGVVAEDDLRQVTERGECVVVVGPICLVCETTGFGLGELAVSTIGVVGDGNVDHVDDPEQGGVSVGHGWENRGRVGRYGLGCRAGRPIGSLLGFFPRTTCTL